MQYGICNRQNTTRDKQLFAFVNLTGWYRLCHIENLRLCFCHLIIQRYERFVNSFEEFFKKMEVLCKISVFVGCFEVCRTSKQPEKGFNCCGALRKSFSLSVCLV